MPKKLRIVVSLTTNDNDYQIEQAQSAEQAASRLGVSVEIIYADNDAINQSTQILKVVQAAPELRPDAVVFEPVGGTALPQVARAAANAGIGWAVLNRDASYLEELRKMTTSPMFGVTSDHVEIGRLQGRQLAALLPKGGSVIYVQGPSENSAAKERTAGNAGNQAREYCGDFAEGAVDGRERAAGRTVVAQADDFTEIADRCGCGAGRFHGDGRAQGVPGIAE